MDQVEQARDARIAVEDGPNDQRLWEQASPRVMHLLKQPTKNDEPAKEAPSLPALIQDRVKRGCIGRGFLYRVALRSYGFLNGFTSWGQAEKAPDGVLGQALLASAIVNLEQVEIAGKTPETQVKRFAERNRERWHGQIHKWKPRVVVCGGTFEAVSRALANPRRCCASTGMSWFGDPTLSGSLYLDAYHPTARLRLPIVYTYLMVSAKEILELGR